MPLVVRGMAPAGSKRTSDDGETVPVRYRGLDRLDGRLRVVAAGARRAFGDDHQAGVSDVRYFVAGTENAVTYPRRTIGDASAAVASMSCG